MLAQQRKPCDIRKRGRVSHPKSLRGLFWKSCPVRLTAPLAELKAQPVASIAKGLHCQHSTNRFIERQKHFQGVPTALPFTVSSGRGIHQCDPDFEIVVSWHHRFMRPRLNRPRGADPAHCARFDSKSIRNLAHAFGAPRIGCGRSRLGETPLVMSIWSASIGNNVRRADSSSLPRPYCHFELQHGPSPNIAHRLFASPESRLARVGMWAISSAVAELRTVAQPQLSFCYFACPTL